MSKVDHRNEVQPIYSINSNAIRISCVFPYDKNVDLTYSYYYTIKINLK